MNLNCIGALIAASIIETTRSGIAFFSGRIYESERRREIRRQIELAMRQARNARE